MSLSKQALARWLTLTRGAFPQQSKLGFHINFITQSSRMRDCIAVGHPRSVLALHHDPQFWRQVSADSPDTLKIGRYHVEDDRQADLIRDPENAARWLVDRIMAREDPYVFDVWVGFNEMAKDDERRWRLMGRFDGAMADLLHAEGLKYGAGSHGVGHPTVLEFVLLPEVQEGWTKADFLFAHEYCSPTMNDPRGLDPLQPGTGWFTLRHRKWYPLLAPECQKPLILTECGIDSGAAHWDPGAQGGWRSFTSPEGYLEQLIWWDQKLQESPYVHSCNIFCWGTLDPRWDSYCINGRMVDLLEQHLRKNWKPGVEPEFPKYHSHVLLVPQEMPDNGWSAIRLYADTFRVTISRSEHDAVLFHGGISHTITAVSPSPGRAAFLAEEQRKRGFALDIIPGDWARVKNILDDRARKGIRVGYEEIA